MIKIRPATEADHTNISVLVVSVFRQRNEAQLIQGLRDGGHVALELVAEDEGGLVAHICLSRLSSPEGWLALAPLSVRAEAQGGGIGSELVRYAADAARQARFKAIVVVGDPDFYAKFGFVFEGPAELTTPYPAQYTGLYPIAPQTAGAEAVLVYPDPFAQV
ncbi:N-acetyltransferase [Fluviibacterium sp. DFM31]|uniref:N-acetyltransferase n=1 Tax=Meridianimarinicoccus marinus TaxID=3231483 RepID=A0ABV3L3F2_9RHOB